MNGQIHLNSPLACGTRILCSVILILVAFQSSSQVATNYTFSQTAGTYTAISGGTLIASQALLNMDDEVFGPISISPFAFDGVTYTHLYISTNGHLTFGKKPTQANYLALSGTETYSGAIAAFSEDLDMASSGSSSIRYEQVGNEFIIQWQNVARYHVFGERISFQIRLNTSNNQINIVYGETIIPGNSNAFPQVGLRGPDNTFSTNVNNRNVQSTTGVWLFSISGTDHSSTCYFNFSAPATAPVSGSTFTWTPPAVDLEAVVFASPDSSGCYGTHETVSVTIRNSGYAAVDFSVSPVSIQCNATGTNPFIFSPAVINSGNLPAGSTQDVIITSDYNMILSGSYVFNANVFAAGDAYVSNNFIQSATYFSHVPGVTASADAHVCENQSTTLNSTANAYPFILSRSNTTLLIIPDNTPAGANSTLDITGATLPASMVSVRIDKLEHTFDNDLILTLTAPDGSSILLCNQRGGGGENFVNTLFTSSAIQPISNGTAPFTGTYLPENPFSALTGFANGTWRLNISDHASADLGALLGWTLLLPVQNSIVSYQWTPSGGLDSVSISNPVATPAATTVYELSVTDASSCLNSDSVKVTVNPFPLVNGVTLTQPDCSLLSGILDVDATGIGTLEYNLNAGAFQTSGTFNGLSPGNYYLHIRSQNNSSCETSYPGNPIVINPGDTESPHINCPGDFVISNDHNQCNAILNFNSPVATDNCSGVTVTCFPASGTAFPVGTTTVTCTATDYSTNSSSCSFNVIVNDIEDPVIHCPPDLFVDADYLQQYASNVTTGTATATDNCGILNIVSQRSDGLGLTSNYSIGTTSISWRATDVNGLVATCTQFITVRDRRSSVVTYTGDTEVQYSDKLVLQAILKEQLSNVPLPGRTVTFYLLGQRISAVTGLSGIATAELIVHQPPGSFVVVTEFLEDNSTAGSTDSDLILIKKEDAEVDYTGPEFISLTCSNCNTASVLLSASIKDISAIAASLDPHPGDIRKARVRFVNVDNNTPISSWLAVGLINSLDTTKGTVTFSWTVSIPPAGYIDPYNIRVEVDNGNYLGSTETVINVCRNSLQDFVSGGGHIIPTNSSGQLSADSAKNLNFGFNVKYNRSGQNLQGSINVTFRRTLSGVKHIYRVKGNSMSFLSVNTDTLAKKAIFICKANLKDNTDPSNQLSFGGNLTLQVTVTDHGAGRSDSIGLTLWSNTNALLYSSDWVSTKTLEKNLAGGNIEVHTGNNPFRITAEYDASQSEINSLQVMVMPNPASDYFILMTESTGKDLIQLCVMNMIGEIIETRNDLVPGEAIEIGNDYKPGIYFVRLLQGETFKTFKILKQQ